MSGAAATDVAVAQESGAQPLSLQDVLSYVESLYPRRRAEEWDRVGLVVGSREEPVRRVLLAVDPVQQTVAEAVTGGYDLLLTHHPLYLRGTSFVSDDDYKGRLVRELIRHDCALYAAHTNADSSPQGVADALAELLGVTDTELLVPAGEPGVGAGRIGKVPPQSLRQFAELVAERLPAGPSGILVGGDPDRLVSRVAVSGGAGDSFLGAAAAAGADVFVTADLRHHPASEHLEDGGPALISGSHWATEWPWLPSLRELLQERFGGRLEVTVSETATEPWMWHLPAAGASPRKDS